MARLARDPEVEALIDAYRDDLVAAGHFAENEVTSPARAFLLRVGGPSGWSRLSVEEQRRICEPRESAVVMWMIAAGRVPATPEFLAGGHQRLGKVSAWVHRDFHRRFMQVADGIGFPAKAAELQWWAVAKVAAVAGVPPHKLSRSRFDAASAELLAAALRADRRSAHRSLSTRLYGAEATLYHAGVINGAPRKRAANQATLRTQEWASVPARLAQTLQGYVEQMRVTLRPNSMPHIERTLREFALAARPGARGHSRPGSPPGAHRALQAPRGAEAKPSRRAAVQAHDRGRALNPADLPGAACRVGRRGRPGANVDVPR